MSSLHNITRLAQIVSMLMCTSVLAGPKVVAHRGASRDAPENTLAAFSLAWKQGADAIECDVRKTKDGQLVCIHDATTKRVAGRMLSVTNSTLKTLQALDVGKWKSPDWKDERIPTLTKVLASVPADKLIFVEIKGGPTIVPLLPAAIERSQIDENQVVIISFDKKVVLKAKHTLSKAKVLLLVDFQYNRFWRSWKPSKRTVLKTMKACEADGVGVRAAAPADEDFFEDIREAGGEVHVWTVNDSETATRFFGLGADSITTDRPQLIQSLNRELQKGKQ
jgi:glycerophosphoryl diester phosphodiesterase